MSNIVVITAPTAGTVPASGADYEAQNNLLNAAALRYNMPRSFDLAGGVIPKGAVIQCGGAVFQASADESITGTASDYVQLTPVASNTQLDAAYVSSLTGVTWSDTYNGYYDASGNLYLFDEIVAYLAGEISSVHTEPGSAAKSVLDVSPPHGKQVFMASGTFDVPLGVDTLYISGCAAGGNGSTGASSQSGSGGGGGEWAINKAITVVPGETLTLSLGGLAANTTITGSSSGLLLTLHYGYSASGVSPGTGGSGGDGTAGGSGGAAGIPGDSGFMAGGASNHYYPIGGGGGGSYTPGGPGNSFTSAGPTPGYGGGGGGGYFNGSSYFDPSPGGPAILIVEW